jgi:hypothetical protein
MAVALTTPSNLKLSQMASVRNGEIPVILVFVRDQVPQNYKLVPPEEAIPVLSLIEFMRDHSNTAVASQVKAETPKNGGLPDDQK